MNKSTLKDYLLGKGIVVQDRIYKKLINICIKNTRKSSLTNELSKKINEYLFDIHILNISFCEYILNDE